MKFAIVAVLFLRGSAWAQQASNVNLPDALTLPRKSAKNGNKPALHELTAMANAGSVTAQKTLGDIYYQGDGVPQDLETAATWYRKAAERGLALAQFNLAQMYANGEGVPNDSTTAVQWYRKAAIQGLAEAQYALGWMYENGEGVQSDSATAVQWYRKAAVQGMADAEFAMGTMFCRGEGVSSDSATAAEWYRKAAKHGSADALQEIQNAHSCENKAEVLLEKRGGVFFAPVLINGRISLDFIVDSGAADVSLPADVVLTLMRTGTLTATDFTGPKTYTLADGSSIPSQTLRIRSLKLGDTVINNVSGSVAPPDGSLLLGQSFLNRLKSWSIDNVRQVLVLKP